MSHADQFKKIEQKVKESSDEDLKDKYHDLEDKIFTDGKKSAKDMVIKAMIALELEERGYTIQFQVNNSWFSE